jgi:hypothetical protein
MKQRNPITILILFLMLPWSSVATAMLSADSTLQRLEQAAEIQALPPVNRETALANLVKPVLEVKPIQDLGIGLRELALNDQLLLKQLKQIKNSASISADTATTIPHYLDLPIRYLDLNLSSRIDAVINAQKDLNGAHTDGEFIAALSSLSTQHYQLIRLAQFRDSLTLAPAIRLSESLRREKSAEVKLPQIYLKKRQQITDAIGAALAELDRISEIHNIQIGLLTHALAKPAFESEQAALLNQLKAFKAFVSDQSVADTSLAGIEKLLVDRFYSIQTLAVGMGTTANEGMDSTLLYPNPVKAKSSSRVLAEWDALRGELGQWSEESANQFSGLLPDLVARNRHIEKLYQNASSDLQTRFVLLSTLIDSQKQVFELFEKQWKHLESGRPSTHAEQDTFNQTLVDTGALLEEFTITEGVLIGVTDQFVSSLVDVENISFDTTTGIQKQLQGLSKRLERISSDHALWLTLQNRAEDYWKRMDKLSLELLAERKEMWGKTSKTAGSVKIADSINRDQAINLVLNAIEEKHV